MPVKIMRIDWVLAISLHKLLGRNKILIDTLVIAGCTLEIKVGILKYDDFCWILEAKEADIREKNKNLKLL